MFRTLCFEYRVVSVPYFLDEMTQYEARDIVKNIAYVDKNDRELARYQLYVAIQSNSKHQIELESVMKLPWDNPFLNKTEFNYNEQEKNKLDEKSSMIEKMLNEGTLNFKPTNLMESKTPKISNNE